VTDRLTEGERALVERRERLCVLKAELPHALALALCIEEAGVQALDQQRAKPLEVRSALLHFRLQRRRPPGGSVGCRCGIWNTIGSGRVGVCGGWQLG
jgi:hypothetical protein